MSRRSTMPEPWLSAAKRLGGVKALADALGTVPRSVHNWAHKRTSPNGAARKLILEVVYGVKE